MEHPLGYFCFYEHPAAHIIVPDYPFNLVRNNVKFMGGLQEASFKKLYSFFVLLFSTTGYLFSEDIVLLKEFEAKVLRLVKAKLFKKRVT